MEYAYIIYWVYFLILGVLRVEWLDKASPNLLTLLAILLPIAGIIVTALIGNGKIKGKLSSEHKDLSKEHTELKGDLLKEHALMAKDVSTIAAATSYLKEENMKEQGRQELRSKKEIDLADTLQRITDIMDENKGLKQQLQELHENHAMQIKQFESTIYTLRQEIAMLHTHIPSFSQEEEMEP